MLKKYIGDKAFYRRVVAVVLPIIIQNGISNFVSLLDNIMVGQVGTAQMSGVSIVNQLMFVFYLCIFGAMSGAGIFTAQFFGRQDHQGVRYTFRFKLIVSLLLSGLGLAVFLLAGEPLIRLYLQGDGDPQSAALSLEHGMDYLKVMLFGLLPFALSNAYAGTLRETGQTTVPMVAGITAVLVNLVLNYILIFGHLGAPAMGVRGAALATIISRFVEFGIIALWTHTNPEKNPFIQDSYRSVHIPRGLLADIIRKGMPLLVNETLYSIGLAIMNQCYSVRGLDVVAALNICTTIYNLSSVTFKAMGNAIGILIGQQLGAQVPEAEVRDSFRKLTALSVVSCLAFTAMMVAFSGLFPQIYNTSDDIRQLATQLICISAFSMPFTAYVFAVYFALRSGGRTVITFLFDCGTIWCINIPMAFLLSRFTGISILLLYALCLSIDALKCVIGHFMIRSSSWMRNLTQA